MKRMMWWVGLLCFALLAVACGAPESLIKESAAKMDLEELGQPFVRTEDLGKDQIVARLGLRDISPVTDASWRTFVASTSAVTGTPAITNTKVFAVVLVYDSSGNANNGLEEAKRGLTDALKKERPDLTLQELNAKVNEQPAFDAAYFAWADIPGPERVYLFLFRKQNVVGLIATAGPLNALGEEQVRGFVTKMFGQMPAAVSP